MIDTRSERLLCGGPAGLRGAIRPGLDLFALLFVSRQKVEKTAEKGSARNTVRARGIQTEECRLKSRDLRVEKRVIKMIRFLSFLSGHKQGGVLNA
jgi:hypothetical protein